MSKEPLKFYRLWCGRKLHSAWLPTKQAAMEQAFEIGLGYRNLNNDGGGGLGPLSWIEEGTRKYARSRTIPVPPLRSPPWA